MEMLTIRCQVCNTELYSSPKFQCCGCSNMTSLHGESVTANDLSKVIMTSNKPSTNETQFTGNDLQFQENRRKRKVRKLKFEER